MVWDVLVKMEYTIMPRSLAPDSTATETRAVIKLYSILVAPEQLRSRDRKMLSQNIGAGVIMAKIAIISPEYP